MSYILDALRRAEAERGRGAVPGLHTPAVPVPGAAPVAERLAAPAWLLAASGLALAAAAVAVAGTWWVMQQHPAPVVVAAAPAPGPAAPAVAPPAAQPIPAPAQPAPALAPTPAPTPVPAVAAPPPEPRPADKRSAAPPREKPAPQVHAPRGAGAELPPRPRADPARDLAPARAPEPAAVAAAPAPFTTATGTVFAQADLPEAVRAQLPSLKISGVTYSGNPAYRMAIVNGQVLHEGDPAGPGLLLERIEPGRTIWSFKGYRYGLASQ